MTPVHLADTALDLRQAVATGRFVEDITGRAIDTFDAVLGYAHAGGAGTLRTSLVRKPGGHFALHMHPERDLPDLATAGTVTLTLRLCRPGLPDVAVVRDVPGTELVPVITPMAIGGQDVTVSRVPAAPLVFTASAPPAPVQLDGLVLLDNDPEAPVDGVTVTAPPAPAVTTGPAGRFRIPALPLAETVTLSLDHEGRVTECPLRPDYSRRVMDAVFTIHNP